MSEILPIHERLRDFITDSQQAYTEKQEEEKNEEPEPLYVLAFEKEQAYHFRITYGGPSIWIYFFVSEGESVPYRAFYYSTDEWEYQEYSLNDEQIETIIDLYGLNFEK